MSEHLIELNDALDTATFYGVNNQNIACLKNMHPKVRVVARGYHIKVDGAAAEIAAFEQDLRKIERFCIEHNTLTEDIILAIIKGEQPTAFRHDNLILHGVNGKSILARSANQQQLFTDFQSHDLLFAVAGEKLGFLPGDMREKIDPYLQPLYDALQDMIPAAKLEEYMEKGVIQIAPLAFMRGRTLSEAVVILDEAQNTTVPQIKMFLTRLGLGGKMIVTGDLTQVDLPKSQRSGLRDALDKLQGIPGISTVRFTQADIVRHPLVQRIVDAYDKAKNNEE